MKGSSVTTTAIPPFLTKCDQHKSQGVKLVQQDRATELQLTPKCRPHEKDKGKVNTEHAFLCNPSFQFTWGVSCDPTTVLHLIWFPPGTMALCGGLLNRNFLCWCKIGDEPSRVEEQRLSFIQTRAKIVYILYNPLEMSVVTLLKRCVNTSLNYLVLPLSLKTATDKLK